MVDGRFGCPTSVASAASWTVMMDVLVDGCRELEFWKGLIDDVIWEFAGMFAGL